MPEIVAKRTDEDSPTYFSDTLALEKEEISVRRQRRANWFKKSALLSGNRFKLATIISSASQPISPEFESILKDISEDAGSIIGTDKDAQITSDFESLLEHDKGVEAPIGLALSGGGNRSASFALGVIQVLQKFNVYKHIDYLSTVSGGGYIGASMSAAYALAPREEPDDSDSKTNDIEDSVIVDEVDAVENEEQKAENVEEYFHSFDSIFTHKAGQPESIFFRHLRNHTDYLTHKGPWDLLKAGARVFRGALINTTIVTASIVLLGILYSFAQLFLPAVVDSILDWLEALIYTVINLLEIEAVFANNGVTLGGFSSFLQTSSFPFTILAFSVFFLSAILPARPLLRWYRKLVGSDSRTELQKLGNMNDRKKEFLSEEENKKKRYHILTLLFTTLLIGVSLDLFNNLTQWISHVVSSRRDTPSVAFAPLAIFSFIFVSQSVRKSIIKLIENKIKENLLSIVSLLVFLLIFLCFAAVVGTSNAVIHGSYIPSVLTTRPSINSTMLISSIAFASIFVLAIARLFLDINTTSLHEFYKEQLGKAFIFFPFLDELGESRTSKQPLRNASDETSISQLCLSDLSILEEEKTWNDMQISEENPSEFRNLKSRRNAGPYHLINATINLVRTSEYYQRGRKADFFLFSPLSVGTDETGYVRTEILEGVYPELTLASAVAISGAAASVNAGNRIPKSIGFIITLINARLNMWIPNPRRFNTKIIDKPRLDRQIWKEKSPGLGHFFQELLGLSNSHGDLVNISDGGHVENIGLYQLLRRRCKLIIVSDAGRDPRLEFRDICEAIRIAQIDLGVRIELPGLDAIRSGETAFAIGSIDYGADNEGVPYHGKLLYLKSTLIGAKALSSSLGKESYINLQNRKNSMNYDSYSYISAHAAKNPEFPHDSTADQFYDEEQFEAYRALGYEIAMSALGKQSFSQPI